MDDEPQMEIYYDALADGIENTLKLSSADRDPSNHACLSYELMHEIFSYLPGQAERHEVSRIAGQPPVWLQCAVQVNRHWRDAAQKCPRLWQYIPLEHPYWASMALGYSRPLSIIIDASPPMRLVVHNAAFNLAVFEASRARCMYLHKSRTNDGGLDSAIQSALWLAFTSGSIRELEVFDSRGLPQPPSVVHKFCVSRMSAPPTIQSACFKRIYLDWEVVKLLAPSLTHLEVIDCAPLAPFVHKVLRVLKLASLLKSFKYKDMPQLDTTACKECPIVELEHLTELELSSDDRNITWLFQFLRAPSCRKLSLRLGREPDTSTNLEPLDFLDSVRSLLFGDNPLDPSIHPLIELSITRTHKYTFDEFFAWKGNDQLLRLLGMFIHLETLRLDIVSSAPDPTSYENLPSGPVALPNLKNIYLTTDISNMHAVLTRYIIVPNSASRRLAVPYIAPATLSAPPIPADNRQLKELFHRLYDRLPTLLPNDAANKPYRSLHILEPAWQALPWAELPRIIATREESIVGAQSSFDFSLNRACGEVETLVQQMLTEILKRPYFSQLHELHVSYNVFGAAAVWTRLQTYLTSVRRVHVYFNAACVAALLRVVDASTRTLFPLFQDIIVNNVDFSDDELASQLYMIPTPFSARFSQPMHLTLRRCHIPSHLRAKLEVLFGKNNISIENDSGPLKSIVYTNGEHLDPYAARASQS